MLGATQIIFDSDPIYSVETQSYCTIGSISKDDIGIFFNMFPKMRCTFINEITSNPFDFDCKEFVELCKSRIPFLSCFDDYLLKMIYYECEHEIIYPSQVMIKAGDICTNIYIVIAGTLDAEITDGLREFRRIDTIGPGSVMGMNFILKKERWHYQIKNNTVHTCAIKKIGWNTFETLMKANGLIKKHIAEYIFKIDT
jgi:hypothetical protein